MHFELEARRGCDEWGHKRFGIHLVKFLSLVFLLFGGLNLLGVLLNLVDEIDEVSVSIRSVVRSSLFSFAQKLYGRLNAPD
jgi:hypothetical protein